MTEFSIALSITVDWVCGPGFLFQPKACPQEKLVLMGSVGVVWNSCWCSQRLSEKGCRQASWASPFLSALLSFSSFLLGSWTSWIHWRQFACSCRHERTNTQAWLVGTVLLTQDPCLCHPQQIGRCLLLRPCRVTLTLWYLTKAAKVSGILSHGNWKILLQEVADGQGSQRSLPRLLPQAGLDGAHPDGFVPQWEAWFATVGLEL